LNQVDPSSAAVLATYVTGENDTTGSGALAFYGGLFFDFVGTRVYTFDTSTKAVMLLGTAPIMVTGAGQSTCVPTDAGPPAPLR
jgi:putative flippase GtrA